MRRVSKIYVGNLPETCRRTDLQSLFEKYGAVEECDIIKNYGFVHMSNEEEAKVAIDALNNVEFQGSNISVEASHSKVRPRPGMGGKGQCYRCGRPGHWSKECPKGPSRPPGMRGDNFRGDFPPPMPPPPPPFYRDRMMSRFGGDRMRPYPDPYERRPPPPPPMRDDFYERRSPFGRMPGPDYMYARRSPPGYNDYEQAPYEMGQRSRFSGPSSSDDYYEGYGGGGGSSRPMFRGGS